MDIKGNIIPRVWYKIFSKTDIKHPKPQLLAINILADIVYWYRPVKIYDTSSNTVAEYRKKFKNDMLQRSYSQFADTFGCSKYQARDAVIFLESMGVIKRSFRNYNGLSNVMFIELNAKVLNELTHKAEKADTPSYKIPREVCENFKGDVLKFQGTYTKNTTKSISKTSSREKPKDFPDDDGAKEILNSLDLAGLRHKNLKDFITRLICEILKTGKAGGKEYPRSYLKAAFKNLTPGDIDTVFDNYIKKAAAGTNITNCESYLKAAIITKAEEKEILKPANDGGIHCGCPSFDTDDYLKLSIKRLMNE